MKNSFLIRLLLFVLGSLTLLITIMISKAFLVSASLEAQVAINLLWFIGILVTFAFISLAFKQEEAKE